MIIRHVQQHLHVKMITHVETVDCTITPETTKAVTCEEDGSCLQHLVNLVVRHIQILRTYKEVVKSSGPSIKIRIYMEYR